MMPTVLNFVGNTPLFEVPYPKTDAVRIFAKLEWHNPSGSVKDRAACAIIQDAVENGLLDNKILIDATSGNTGIAYATFGAALGLPIELALPENASRQRKQLLQNLGATLHLTSPMEGTDGAQRYVKQRVEDQPERYYYPDQYNNDNNWKAHFKGTGPEIWAQTHGGVTHFVAGLGTTGTFCGTTRFLQPKGVQCVSIQPDNPMHGLEGWKHMPTAIVPGIYDDSLADSSIEMDTERAFKMARAAARYLGLSISPSAAANLAGAIQVADTLESGVVVTVFPDNNMKYLDDAFWSDDDYLIENPFI